MFLHVTLFLNSNHRKILWLKITSVEVSTLPCSTLQEATDETVRHRQGIKYSSYVKYNVIKI